MLSRQKSLKSRFRAIWLSIALTTPHSFCDRLKFLTSLVIKDSLDDLQLEDRLETTMIAIAVGAYWHQDLWEVRSRLLELESHSNIDIQELVLAYAIALACREQLQPQLFINQICNDFGNRIALGHDPQSQSQCLSQIQNAQKLVSQGASMITAHRLEGGLSDAIASSLYYFLTTPHSWRLIAERTQKHPQQNRVQVITQSTAIAAAYWGEITDMNIAEAELQQSVWEKAQTLGEEVWENWAGVFDCAKI